MPTPPELPGASLGGVPSTKLKEAFLTTDGFPQTNLASTHESMQLAFNAEKGGLTWETLGYTLAGQGTDNYMWKMGLNLPIYQNDNLTWGNLVKLAHANRCQFFAQDDDGRFLNLVKNASNDFITTPNGSNLITLHGTKRTTGKTDRKIEVMGQTFLWPAVHQWLYNSAQTAAYINGTGQTGGATLSLSDVTAQVPMLPGIWDVAFGSGSIGEMLDCTFTEELQGEQLQFGQYPVKELKLNLSIKGAQLSFAMIQGFETVGFRNQAVVMKTPNGEVITCASGTFVPKIKYIQYGNDYATADITCDRTISLNAAGSHTSFAALAVTYTY